jgi:NAD(P)-dependent dehydrogenase (short-subunit alcohol dehydrogenase family)
MIDNDFHLTTDSIERTFAVGYISHYVFTTALMPALAPGARIVNVSSYAQVNAKIIMDVELINDPNGELNSWLKRYIHTKAAQVMFTRALQERVGTSVFVNVCHPGQISTGLNRSITAPETGIQAYIIRFGMWMWDLPTDIGALTPLYLATSPEVEKKCIKGKYFVPVAHQSMKLINPAALNHELVDKFWTWTESLAKQKIGVYFFV